MFTQVGCLMRTWLAGMAAVLGLVLVAPAAAEAQTECELCEMDWCEIGGEQSLCHRFVGEGEVKFECGGMPLTDLLAEVDRLVSSLGYVITGLCYHGNE